MVTGSQLIAVGWPNDWEHDVKWFVHPGGGILSLRVARLVARISAHSALPPCVSPRLAHKGLKGRDGSPRERLVHDGDGEAQSV